MRIRNLFILLLFVSVFLSACNEKKIEEEKTELDHSGELHLSDQQIELGNITVDSVRERKLGNELFLTGALSENQNKTSVISSWVMGRIEKLYFKSVGDQISVGDPLYEIYSDDLNLTIKELKLAVEKKKLLTQSAIDIDRIITGAKKKLLIYGLSEKQINAIETDENIPEVITIKSKHSGTIAAVDVTEGSYVMEGGPVYHLSDYSGLWAEAQIFSEDLVKVPAGIKVRITIPEIPDFFYDGNVSFVNPELTASSKINLLRIEIPNKKNILRPGMQANFVIRYDEFETLAIPTDAILLDQKGATVWIKTGHNKFKSVMVETGTESNGFTEIKSGLNKKDIVVISGAYLLNSEYIFKTGANPMEGHKM